MQSRALTFAYEIVDAASGDLLVTGTSRHVCITHDGRVTTLPLEWRSWGDDTTSPPTS
jgi:acyl-CoA thioesterase FadM